MGDTDLLKKPTTKILEVKPWTIEALKMLLSVIIALAFGYTAFKQLETKVTTHDTEIKAMAVKLETTKDAASETRQELGMMKSVQTMQWEDFKGSFKRLEEDMKEMKADIKSIPRAAPTK